MGGYIGSRPVVVQVDGYQREESESRYVNATGDDFSGHLDFVDDAKARFGDSDELQIWTQSDGDGNSYLDGNKIIIRSAAGVARLSITSNDVDITSGALKIGGSTTIDSSRNMLNVGTFSSTGQLQVTNGSITLTGGYNVQWGTGYANGDPAIWGNTTASALRFAPTGSTDGVVVEIDDTGLDVAVGGLFVGGTTVIDSSRNVTVGSATFSDTVQITSGANLSTLNADGWLLIGTENAYNMAFDENEIQARNNGAANQLVLQKNGGNTSFGTTDTQMWDNAAGGNTGVVIHDSGYISVAASDMSPIEANRMDGEGNIINMRINGAIRGRIKTYAANEFGIRSEKHFLNLTANGSNSGLTYWNDGSTNHYFKPFDAETGLISLGKSSAKWADFWMTGTAYIDGSVAIGSDHAPSATYGPTAHIKGSNPNLRLEGIGTGSWAYFELNNANYERSFGMSTDGTFRITDQRGDMDNGVQLQLQQNGRFNVLETISAGTTVSALKGYFYENTANQNGSAKPTSVLGVAAYTDNVGEGPSIDFTSVWTGSAIYQQDNWNEGWMVGRIAAVYDNQVSNGGALVFHTHTGTSATGGASNTSVGERFRIKPEGQLTVSGTTPIATQEGILRSGNIISSAGTNQTTPTMHGFGQIFIRDWPSGRYVHMKTDIPTGTANHEFGMYAIKVVGYIYGSAKTIDGIWAAHNWNGNVYSKAHTNNGSAAFVYDQYVSSDGYVVLVGDVGAASNSMYAGWTMDFHYTNTNYAAHTGTAYDAHTISAHSISSSTSGVY